MARVHQNKRRIGATVAEHVHGHEHRNSHDGRRVAATQRQGTPQGGKENRQVRHQQAEGQGGIPRVHDPGVVNRPGDTGKNTQNRAGQNARHQASLLRLRMHGCGRVTVKHTESLHGRNLLRHLIRVLKSLLVHHRDLGAVRLHCLALRGAITVNSSLQALISRVELTLNTPGENRAVLVVFKNLQGTVHNLVHAHVVGVAVTAVRIVGDQNIRGEGTDSGNQRLSLRFQRLRGQRISRRHRVGDGLTLRAPSHAGVTVQRQRALRDGGFLTQEELLLHAQRLDSAGKLTGTVLAQRLTVIAAAGLTNLQVMQLLGDDLTQLTAGSGQQVHLRALLRIVRHGCAGRGGFVVRVCMHKQDACLLRIVVIRQQVTARSGGDALTLRGIARGRRIRLSVLGFRHRLSLSYAGSGFRTVNSAVWGGG